MPAGALLLRRIASYAMLAGLGAGLLACTTTSPEAGLPTAPFEAAVEQARATPAGAGVRDLRGEYRRALCPRLPAGLDCASVLLQLPGERPDAGAGHARRHMDDDAPAALARRYRLAFVPGLLAGCAGSTILPFQDAVDALRAAGFDARILAVDGRAAAVHNADLLARQLLDTNGDPRPLIVFGYSKGLPDLLETLVRYPAVGSGIAAVVSYAGAVGGTRLADGVSNLSIALLEHLPMPGCSTGDGSDVQDLRRDVRLAWWRTHHAKLRVPFFSIVAAPRADRVSAPLRGTYAGLSRTDALNDGQIAAADAIVPGGALLGYVNADHWAIAIPLSRQLPMIGALFIDDVPRTELVLAAVQVIHHRSPQSHEPVHRP